MIECCIRLIKKYPYILMGFLGIAMMVGPVIVGTNLPIIESVVPFARPVVSPLVRSLAFEKLLGTLPAIGLTVAVIAIYLNNRSEPPSKS